jgi:ribosomal protein S1
MEILELPALAPKTKLTGTVIKTSIAGAIIDIGQPLPGVIHISQLRKDPPVNRVEEVLQVGQQVEVWVKRVREDRIELTMIEPLPLEWKEMTPGMVVKGKVVRIENYGAFVEIGAERPALIHVSEMAHHFVKHPREILKEGDEIEAVLLSADRRKKQIRLSLKALQPEPVVAEATAEASKAERPRKGKKARNVEKAEKAQKSEKAEKAESPVAAVERSQESTTTELTAMQIAWLEALERAKARQKQSTLN